MKYALVILFGIPAVASAFIASPWRRNPRGKKEHIIFAAAFVYLAIYFCVCHFWLKAF